MRIAAGQYCVHMHISSVESCIRTVAVQYLPGSCQSCGGSVIRICLSADTGSPDGDVLTSRVRGDTLARSAISPRAVCHQLSLDRECSYVHSSERYWLSTSTVYGHILSVEPHIRSVAGQSCADSHTAEIRICGSCHPLCRDMSLRAHVCTHTRTRAHAHTRIGRSADDRSAHICVWDRSGPLWALSGTCSKWLISLRRTEKVVK